MIRVFVVSRGCRSLGILCIFAASREIACPVTGEKRKARRKI